MKHLHTLATLAAVLSLAGCVSSATMSTNDSPDDAQLRTDDSGRHEAILLVSLDDGSVVMQKITSDAEVCFKVNSESATTCLKQGEAVVDPDTNAVIGYKMIEDQIELYAKSD